MTRGSALLKVLAITTAWMGTVTVLRFKPWKKVELPEGALVTRAGERTKLAVGFLPVT